MAEKLVGAPWWDPASKADPHQRLIPLVRTMQRQQAARYQNMRKMIAVYEGGFIASVFNTALDPINEHKLQFNVAKNAIDTMHAQVCTPRVAPMLLTEGGTFFQRQRAKTATKAVEGVFDENGFEEIQEDITLDAKLAYCGFALVRSEVVEEEPEGGDESDSGEPREPSYRGTLCIERVDPLDVYVDEAEGRYRAPRCIYRRQLVDRYVLLATYGEAEEGLYGSAKDRKRAIERAKGGSQSPDEVIEQTDMVEVWEAWHLPSGPVRKGRDGKPRTDGRHCICIDGATLVDEPWTRARFPIAVYRPEKARKGFWGLAAMAQAMAGQKEYERVTEKLQRAHKRMGGSHFVVNKLAKLNVRTVGNGIADILEVEGDPNAAVKEWTPQAANPETYQYREGLATDVLRFLGVSSYAAQSEVPAGLQQASGKALNAFEDQENKRLILRHRARERFVVECTELVIEEALSLLEKGVRIISRYRDKRGFEPIDWADIVEVLQDRDAYVVKTFPVSMLMQSPAAKFQQLDMLLERQAITIEQFKRLFELPDLEAENDVDCADYEVIDRNVDYMVLTGKYVAPQPFDNLEIIKVRAGKAYNAYRIAEVPEGRLELIRRYTVDAQALIDEAKAKAQAAAAAGPPPGAGAPMGAGMGGPMAGGLDMMAGAMPPAMPPQGAPPMAPAA